MNSMFDKPAVKEFEMVLLEKFTEDRASAPKKFLNPQILCCSMDEGGMRFTSSFDSVLCCTFLDY